MFDILLSAPGKQSYTFHINKYYARDLHEALCDIHTAHSGAGISGWGNSFRVQFPMDMGEEYKGSGYPGSTWKFSIDAYDKVANALNNHCTSWETNI